MKFKHSDRILVDACITRSAFSNERVVRVKNPSFGEEHVAAVNKQYCFTGKLTPVDQLPDNGGVIGLVEAIFIRPLTDVQCVIELPDGQGVVIAYGQILYGRKEVWAPVASI